MGIFSKGWLELMFSKNTMSWITRVGETVKPIFLFGEKKRYFQWKKAAMEAKKQGLTTTCGVCNNLIFPGEFVGLCRLNSGENEEVIIHAGFHYSLENSKSVFCETGAIGIGHWNGKEIAGSQESAVLKAIRTGEIVVSG